jgi:ABC-type oligopeptide transport system ATPase subunit
VTFELPEPDYCDDEVIEWRVKGFPDDLLSCLYKFTRIPQSDFILPIIASYELLPVQQLNVVSGLSCYGPSGSGKSSLGNLLQRLNPCFDGSIKPLSAMDSPNGWLQSLSKFRWEDSSGLTKPCPFVAIDDLTSKTLLGDVGNQRLQIIKQLPNKYGVVSKGSTDGEPVEYHTFTKFLLSSITDLGGIEGLSELNRRVIVIRHKPLSEWTEQDFSDRNRGEHLENPSDFTGWSDYPNIKLLWLTDNRDAIVKHRTTVKRFYKANREGYPIPEMLCEFYHPILSMGMTAGYWTHEEGLDIFTRLLEHNKRKGTENHLKTIIEQWLQLEEGYAKQQRRFEKYGSEYEVDYSRVVKFLKQKVTEMELTSREIRRECILGAFSDLGFRVSVENASPVIIMEGKQDD